MSSFFFFFCPERFRILTRLLTHPGLDSKNYTLPLRPHWLGFATNGAHQDPAPGKSLSVCLPDTMLRFQPQFMRSSTFALLFIRSTLKAPLDSVTIDKEHIDEILRTYAHTQLHVCTHTHCSHTLAEDQRDICCPICGKPSIKVILAGSCRKLGEDSV